MKRFFARLIGRVSQVYTKLFPEVLKKRTWWPVFVVGVLLIIVVCVVPAHAGIIEGVLETLADAFARLLIELAKLCIFLAIFFLRAFVTLASYNNYIDVSVVKLGWVMVRDVANMFFIVGLLVIAFATILGLESYEWKKGVMKIILMAILINFSNLIAQLIIDVAHIFTITFLNAVSATAGGNLISLFQMDKILSMVSGAPDALGATRDVASLTLFAGAVLAFVFALLAALTIGAYLVVMIARIVVLWALIILSPLAFMLYAVPKGEEYAHEWWSEFSKHVIVAPVMVFFLWLAFATFGTGQIITEIQSDPNVIQINATGEADTVGKQSVSILEISTWENLASFLLGIAFLWVGIKKTEESGATGSHLVGSAIDYTKNVATIATGYAAGRWLVGGAVGKAKEQGKNLVGGMANRFPVVGGAAFKEYGAAIKSTYQKKGLLGVATLGKKSGLGGYESMIRRSETAKKLEENGELKMFGKKMKFPKPLAWLIARTVEPAGRSGKRAHDWEEGAERIHEVMEESYSTSGSRAGQAKLTATLKLKDVEHRAHLKAEAKVAERMKENKLAIDELEKIAEHEAHKDPEFHKKIEALEHEKEALDLEEKALKDRSEKEWRNQEGISKSAVLSEDQQKARDKHFNDVFVETNEAEVKELAQRKKDYTTKEKKVSHEEHELIEKKILPKLMGDKAVLAEVKSKVLEEMTKGFTGSKKKDAQKKLEKIMDRDGGIQKRIIDGKESHDIHKTSYAEKAKTEEANKPLRRATEKAEAEARDDILAAQGLPIRFAQAVDAKHEKEEQEERAGLNFRELTEQTGKLASTIKELRDKAKVEGVKPSIDPNALKALGTTLVVAMKRGYEFESMAMYKALSAIGFKEKINADNMQGQQRKLLSAILGRVVSEEDVKKSEGGANGILQREFVNVVGPDAAQAFLKELDAGIKASVKEGGVDMTGLLDDSNLKNGRIVFRLRDETQISGFKEARKYWAEEVDLPKLLGLGNIINQSNEGITLRKVGVDGSRGDIKSDSTIDEQAVEQMATVFASFKKNTRLHNRAVVDLKNLFETDAAAFERVIEKLGGKTSEAGKALADQVKGIRDTEKEASE